MARKRHVSRIAVMQVLFEREKHPSMGDADASLARNALEIGEYDHDFAVETLTGTLDKEQALKDAIQQHAPEWPLERMDPISRCTLLLAAYELLYKKDAPPAVVMNEAIEIAKEYGTEEGAKFVNGVLNAIAHAS
jgi:N utilization substance protein B